MNNERDHEMNDKIEKNLSHRLAIEQYHRQTTLHALHPKGDEEVDGNNA